MELIADLHTHTIASGHAYSTVMEMVAGAKEKGLKVLAITDHGPKLPGGPHMYHFTNERVIPRHHGDLELLWGVEANVINEAGELDLPDNYLAMLDIVLAGFHPEAGYDNHGIEANTRAFAAAIRHPLVNAITHPGNPYYPVDYDQVIPMAKEYGTALEINNSSFSGFRKGSYEVCSEVARLAKRYGAQVIISSDAHMAHQIATFDTAIEVATRGGLTQEDVLNASLEGIAKLRSKKLRGALR